MDAVTNAIEGGFYAKLNSEGSTCLKSSAIAEEVLQTTEEEIEEILFTPIDSLDDVEELGYIHTTINELLPILQVGNLMELSEHDSFLEMAEDKLAKIQEKIIRLTIEREEEDNDEI